MRNRWRSFLLLSLMVLTVAPQSANAGPYDLAICPIIAGRFFLQEGQLWLTVLKQDGKPVPKRTEKIANPLDERSHDALVKRGTVTVEVHQDKRGGLFVHWGTIAEDKE